MIQSKPDFIKLLFNIVQLTDTETALMAINGVMAGHGVTWKPVHKVLIAAAIETAIMVEPASITIHATEDYFIYYVNKDNGHPFFFSLFRRLCEHCMDFTLMESGNKVNLSTAEGPF